MAADGGGYTAGLAKDVTLYLKVDDEFQKVGGVKEFKAAPTWFVAKIGTPAWLGSGMAIGENLPQIEYKNEARHAFKPGKTIYIPKALLRDWLSVLRSGKVVQGKGALIEYDHQGQVRMCVLGVLEYCAAKLQASKVENRSMPSVERLKEMGVEFDTRRLMPYGHGYVAPTVNYNGKEVRLSELNDMGMPFSMLATFIEMHAEAY